MFLDFYLCVALFVCLCFVTWALFRDPSEKGVNYFLRNSWQALLLALLWLPALLSLVGLILWIAIKERNRGS